MFTKNEIRDLTISVFALALIFSSFDFSLFLTTIFVVIIAFFAHEMSHKFVAMHYGCDAEYRMWPLGLVLGLVTALIPGGFVIAAPGAVYISPYKKGFAFKVANLSRKNYAIISLSGPLVNIALASSLFLLSIAYPLELFIMTARISFFLAFFNLLPIPPMDGSKIMSWNIKIWGALLAIALIGSFVI
jgi:Zn-dependent protease